MSLQAEILSEEEIAAITGYMTASRQIQWLSNNSWHYVLTAARRPVVGRVYARLKLSGVKPTSGAAVAEAWTLDLAKVS